MNLQTLVSAKLWEAIASNYQKQEYRGAVLDSVQFLSELLREKSGLEGDGVALVGQALGGASPKIKLNRLRSESEINIQKGTESILRGIFQAIRNPRSHDKVIDSEHDADALILFVDYLTKQLDAARAQFSRTDFVGRVLDPDFVPKTRYAKLLAKSVPPAKRLDIFVDLYDKKHEWKAANLRIFFGSFLGLLHRDERRAALDVVSEDLKVTNDPSTIRAVIGALGPYVWSRIDQTTKLRIEHKLIKSISQGSYDTATGECRGGSLGTWITHIYKELDQKEHLKDTLAQLLASGENAREGYVFEYLLHHVCHEKFSASLERALIAGLEAGTRTYHDALDKMSFFDDLWTEPLKKAFADFKEKPPVDLAAKSFEDDDIPF